MALTVEDRLAIVELIAPVLGFVAADRGAAHEIDKTFRTGSSVLYDALFVPGGTSAAGWGEVLRLLRFRSICPATTSTTLPASFCVSGSIGVGMRRMACSCSGKL